LATKIPYKSKACSILLRAFAFFPCCTLVAHFFEISHTVQIQGAGRFRDEKAVAKFSDHA